MYTNLREEMKKRREELSSTYVAQYSAKTVEALYTHLNAILHFYDAADISVPILGYYPLGNEVDLRELYQRLWKDGRKVLFPVTEEEEITFYPAYSLEEFQEGRFHVYEPQCREFPFSKYTAPIVVLTPGVVFDRQGNRMGFGKGYYDRFLKKCKLAIKIGIAYDFQVVDQLEVMPWDVPMDEMLPNIMEEKDEQFDGNMQSGI